MTLALGNITMSGPSDLVKGVIYGAPTRMPIFVANVSANETFGNDVEVPTGLNISQVYNYNTSTKFWVSVGIHMSGLAQRRIRPPDPLTRFSPIDSDERPRPAPDPPDTRCPPLGIMGDPRRGSRT